MLLIHLWRRIYLYYISYINVSYTLVQVETAIMKSLRVDQTPCNLWMDMKPVGGFESSNRSGREKYQGAKYTPANV